MGCKEAHERPDTERWVCAGCWPDITFYGEFPKGYAFFRNDGWNNQGVPEGGYCLVADGHSLLYTFTTEPKPDLDLGGDWDGDNQEFMDAVEAIEPAFHGHPTSGWCLVDACEKSGWRWGKDMLLVYWMTDQMAKLIAAYDAAAVPA